MKSKAPVFIGILVGLFFIAGAFFVYSNTQKSMEAEDKINLSLNEESSTSPQTSESETTTQTIEAESSKGTYISRSEYEADTTKYASTNKVYFFHASWCSICQGIEKEIEADISRIPNNTTFIKTDYDSSTDLRKKYGVTYQYTFVQVDENGNELSQWSATSLDKAIAGIKS